MLQRLFVAWPARRRGRSKRFSVAVPRLHGVAAPSSRGRRLAALAAERVDRTAYSSSRLLRRKQRRGIEGDASAQCDVSFISLTRMSSKAPGVYRRGSLLRLG